jgi:hypothetical protein
MVLTDNQNNDMLAVETRRLSNAQNLNEFLFESPLTYD